jgi:hypothetical protein
MLPLNKHTVKITHASLTAENHGKDSHATGMTLKFKTNMDAALLDTFDKSLRSTMFRGQEPGDQMDIERKNDGPVMVRYPKLSPFVWTEEFPGYEAEVGAVGLGLTDPIQIVDATLKGVSFRALEGGSVELIASLYFHPDEDEVGPLARLMKEEAELTLTPPSAQTRAANDDLADAA